MLWIYSINVWLFCALAIAAWVVFSLAGLFLTRGLVARLWAGQPHNDIVSFFLAAVGVFYGISLGLIAVGAWQNYAEVETKVSQEASSLAALWRDVSDYPEPARADMRALLKRYTRLTIDSAWADQQRDSVSKHGLEEVHQVDKILAAFEPKTAAQTALHAETLRQFNQLMYLRQLRMASVSEQLPVAVWIVAILGGIINVVVTWLFLMPRLGAHALLTAPMGALVGLLIFLTAAVDHPYLGSVSVSAESFSLVFDEQMR